MGHDLIRTSVERVLQSMEDLIGQQSGPARGNKGPPDVQGIYDRNVNALEVNWSRLQSQKGGISKQARELACAKTWTNAFLDLKLALRIGLVLATVREQAEAATSDAGTSEASRCVSLHSATSTWIKEILHGMTHKIAFVAVAHRRGAVPFAGGTGASATAPIALPTRSGSVT